jgi:hypothetical protein
MQALPPIVFGSKVILSNVAISIYLLYIQTKLIKFSIPIVTSALLKALYQSISKVLGRLSLNTLSI